jgi:hypothetical protein
MDLSIANQSALRLAAPSRAIEQGVTRPWLPAALVTLGTVASLFGISWDIQWHVDVGPDTFYTLPHLMLYSGTAIAGITSLTVVLMTTARQRAGQPMNESGANRDERLTGGRRAV